MQNYKSLKWRCKQTHSILPWPSQRTPCLHCRTAGLSVGRNKICINIKSKNVERLSIYFYNVWLYLSISACIWEPPHFATRVTKRTHDYVCIANLCSIKKKSKSGFITQRMFQHGLTFRKYLQEGWRAEKTETVQKDDDSNDCRRHQEICVPAQPQEIQGHLFSKVVPDKEIFRH